MPLDEYMAGRCRYRHRRHTASCFRDDEIVWKPHQTHYESTNNNSLNGGGPKVRVRKCEFAGYPLIHRIISTCNQIFSGC
ncbi:2OG-Fe dioxygenase family protein [Sphingobium yanoikuyae]